MTYRCPLCKHTFEADVVPIKHDYCGYRGKFDEPVPATQPSPMFVPWPGRDGGS